MGQYLSLDFGYGYTLGSHEEGWNLRELTEFFDNQEDASEVDIEDFFYGAQQEGEDGKDYWARRKIMQSKSCFSFEFSGVTEHWSTYHLMHKQSTSSVLEAFGVVPDISRFGAEEIEWASELKAELAGYGIDISQLGEPEFMVVCSYG